MAKSRAAKKPAQKKPTSKKGVVRKKPISGKKASVKEATSKRKAPPKKALPTKKRGGAGKAMLESYPLAEWIPGTLSINADGDVGILATDGEFIPLKTILNRDKTVGLQLKTASNGGGVQALIDFINHHAAGSIVIGVSCCG